MTGPLTQPGLNVHVGDCITAIGGKDVTAAEDIQRPLEGTAGHAVTLHVTAADGSAGRDITVIPVRSEAALRNVDWIEGNQKKVDQMSGGKLAYVYLPDTGEGRLHQLQPLLLCPDRQAGRGHRRALQRRRAGCRLHH